MFYKVRLLLDSPIVPRRGTSAYNMENQIFVFGGVYEREFNYL